MQYPSKICYAPSTHDKHLDGVEGPQVAHKFPGHGLQSWLIVDAI